MASYEESVITYVFPEGWAFAQPFLFQAQRYARIPAGALYFAFLSTKKSPAGRQRIFILHLSTQRIFLMLKPVYQFPLSLLCASDEVPEALLSGSCPEVALLRCSSIYC